MIYENGAEEQIMSKQEAKASVKEMGNMMEFFDGICEKCGKQRKNCSDECVSTALRQ